MSDSPSTSRPKTAKRRGKQLVSDNTELTNGHHSPSADDMSVWKKVVDFDVHLTSQLACCASSKSSLGMMRPVMVLLEYSCHGVPWLLATLSAILMSHQVHLQEKLVNLFAALLFDLVVVGSFKLLFRRNRPSQNQNDNMYGTVSLDRHSFPSGHATRAVMTTIFLLNNFPFGMKWITIGYTWMVSVCCSRVLLGRHHVLDVCAGVLLGVLEYLLMIKYLWLPEETCLAILSPIREDLYL